MKPADITKHARRVVFAADKDGSLDRGELTMRAARELVCLSMGLELDAADSHELKKAVKQAVQDAIAEVEASAARGAEDEGHNDEDSPPPKKRKSSDKEANGRKADAYSDATSSVGTSSSNGGRKKAQPKDGHRSVETIENSDDEGSTSHEPSSYGSSVESDVPQKSKLKTSVSKRASLSKTTSVAQPKRRARSGSISSMDDEPPPAKKRATKKTKSKKDPNEGLSPDEARVADLKKIVVACGVRKQWGKELAECHTPKSQIAHLKDLLQSLGMKGQPTMNKAKTLKEKRLLAQEISDVKEYEAERGLSAGGRSKRRRISDPDSDEDRRKEAQGGATAAVLAFLGDDSD